MINPNDKDSILIEEIGELISQTKTARIDLPEESIDRILKTIQKVLALQNKLKVDENLSIEEYDKAIRSLELTREDYVYEPLALRYTRAELITLKGYLIDQIKSPALRELTLLMESDYKKGSYGTIDFNKTRSSFTEE